TRERIIMIKRCLAVVSVAALTQFAIAQTSQPATADASKPDPLAILKNRPDTPRDTLLSGTYQNPLAGLAFRVPGSCQQIKGNGGDEIARFANNEKSWELIVTKASTAQPLPLHGDDKKLGLLEVLAARLKQSNPAIE